MHIKPNIFIVYYTTLYCNVVLYYTVLWFYAVLHYQWQSRGYCRQGLNIYMDAPIGVVEIHFVSEIAAPVKVPPPFPPPPPPHHHLLCHCVLLHTSNQSFIPGRHSAFGSLHVSDFVCITLNFFHSYFHSLVNILINRSIHYLLFLHYDILRYFLVNKKHMFSRRIKINAEKVGIKTERN